MNETQDLYSRKTEAVDRMQEINALATKEARDLTASEAREYNSKKLEAEVLVASINKLTGKENTTMPYNNREQNTARQSGESIEREVETLARDVAQRDKLTKETATVRVISANPKLYDQYLAANPAQTGARQ